MQALLYKVLPIQFLNSRLEFKWIFLITSLHPRVVFDFLDFFTFIYRQTILNFSRDKVLNVFLFYSTWSWVIFNVAWTTLTQWSFLYFRFCVSTKLSSPKIVNFTQMIDVQNIQQSERISNIVVSCYVEKKLL